MCKRHIWAIAALVTCILAITAPARDLLISVNCDVSERDQGQLDGPLDGDGGSDVGTTWNQIPLAGPGRGKSPVILTDLRDSTNESTTVSCNITLDGN
ncbi:MAG: hypothetical protein K9N55_12410 [Phycisphaerae bacterium]|nr:hypothetical protein [Phycisphaerae bacterium]